MSVKNKRAFKGIWIPREVWVTKELTVLEKIFYVEIDSLDNEDGCFAGNEYFAQFFGLSKSQCSRIISSLYEKKFIDIVLNKRADNKTKRVMRVCAEMRIPYTQKCNEGIRKNDEHNNTGTNNTENNIGESSDSRKKEVQELMDLFYQFNPALKFGNKTERKACEEMIEKWDFEKVKHMAIKVISVQGTDKFAPRASTPSKMWNKIAEFAAYFKAGAKTGKVVRRA